ncbi:hypothetical protein N657DRAFT_462805 [Parathielavia appendiculata]|uniref:Uncharacterized protein n=1 Tax=Parathielavia appendiculata TaxID=2587402 RepID=A0AAN6Z3E8_9PEZI|nr:hypothetical protein N657DRAFT_462805 [Parathielavia appendiculata]
MRRRSDWRAVAECWLEISPGGVMDVCRARSAAQGKPDGGSPIYIQCIQRGKCGRFVFREVVFLVCLFWEEETGSEVGSASKKQGRGGCTAACPDSCRVVDRDSAHSKNGRTRDKTTRAQNGSHQATESLKACRIDISRLNNALLYYHFHTAACPSLFILTQACMINPRIDRKPRNAGSAGPVTTRLGKSNLMS